MMNKFQIKLNKNNKIISIRFHDHVKYTNHKANINIGNTHQFSFEKFFNSEITRFINEIKG